VPLLTHVSIALCLVSYDSIVIPHRLYCTAATVMVVNPTYSSELSCSFLPTDIRTMLVISCLLPMEFSLPAAVLDMLIPTCGYLGLMNPYLQLLKQCESLPVAAGDICESKPIAVSVIPK
jgi:hypothetical protein